MSHPMTIGCEWHCHLISLPGCLINYCHVSSHDHSTMWVTLPLYFFARLSHQSLPCLIPWPQGVSDTATLFLCQAVSSTSTAMSHPMTTGMSEWHCHFISLPGCLINHCHVSSHDHREWVTLPLYFFTRLSHQSCLTHDQQAVSVTVPFISLPTTSLCHDQLRL